MDINSLIKSAKNAIFYVEDVEAEKLLKQIDSFIDSQNLQQSNPQLLSDLKKIKIYLKIVAFSRLSDKESADILKNYYLESFDIDVSMENQLIGKLFLEPIIPRDNLRNQLKQALLQNQQKIGPLSISQWITEFEKSYDVHTRKPSSIIDFSLNNANIRKLDQISQNKLKKILRTYDYLLVSTIPTTEPELSEILESLGPNDSLFSTENSNTSNNLGMDFGLMQNINFQEDTATEKSITSLNIPEALENYPEIGEQLITSNRLKLKSFPEPARPSIKNWLSDYTFNLGFSSHSAMDRGTYLFRNENARVLNSADRERLSFVLKAYDENTPVDINVNTKQIIFSRRETRSSEQRTTLNNPPFQAPQRNISEIYPHTNSIQEVKKDSNSSIYEGFDRSKTNQIGVGGYNRPEQSNQPQDIFEKTKAFTEKGNYSVQNSIPQTKNLNFSSPQRLASEKQIQSPQKIYSPNPQKIIGKPAAPNNNVPPGNVVNLKDSK